MHRVQLFPALIKDPFKTSESHLELFTKLIKGAILVREARSQFENGVTKRTAAADTFDSYKSYLKTSFIQCNDSVYYHNVFKESPLPG